MTQRLGVGLSRAVGLWRGFTAGLCWLHSDVALCVLMLGMARANAWASRL